MYGNGRCAQPNDQDDGRCWAFEDRYGTDRCTIRAIAPNREIGTGVAVGRWEKRTVLNLVR